MACLSFFKRLVLLLQVSGLLIVAMSGQVYAYRPISSQKPVLDGIYPEYPKIDYGSGDQAKLIKKGEYLAKIGDCIACHTNTAGGGKAFAGQLAINTPFGTFYSPNITPDKETGIGNWTADDLIRAMQEGKNPHGDNYFPVFPYVFFSKTSKDDIRAIYAYLMALPPVKQKNKTLPFPFDVPGARLSLYGWNLLFFYPYKGEYQYDSSKSKEWNRGAYIVNSYGHCSMCHTPLNAFGAPKRKYFLTGGFVDGYWAPNITKWGLKSASKYEVADVFIKGELINKAGPVTGPMAEVNHDSLRYLTRADQEAIATYLKTVVSEEPLGLPASEKQPTIKRGKQVYIKACIICHQNGVMTAPILGDSGNWYMRLSEQGLPALYRHAINGYNSMPVKGACVTCSDNDIKSAVDYLLSESLTRSQWIDLKNGKMNKVIDNGQDVYNENCSVCHAEGKLGAPKVGDTRVWNHILNNYTFDQLIELVVSGKGKIDGRDPHPVNGGCEHCTTREIIAATKYMLKQSKVKGNYSLW